jgi:hypothetical protein
MGETLIGMELVTDNRVDAVGADEHLARHLNVDIRTTIPERRRNQIVALVERCEAHARVESLGPKSVEGGLPQQHLQLAAMDRELRPRISGGEPPRLLLNSDPITRQEGQRLGSNSGGIKSWQEPEVVEHAYRVRQHVDADAQLGWLDD